MDQEKRSSILISDKTIPDVLHDMVAHVINNEVLDPPFISVLSKKQIWFGNGHHFNNAENNYISKGLRANMGVRIPSNDEIKSAQSKYGYDALQKPWPEMNRITNICMRMIQKLTLPKEEYEEIRVVLGKGYFTNEGKPKYEQTTGIAVYIIFLADPEKRAVQNEWIKNQPMWVHYQILRSQIDHPKILAEKKQSASALVLLNRKLIQQQEYLQLEPGVDRQETPWENEDLIEQQGVE